MHSLDRPPAGINGVNWSFLIYRKWAPHSEFPFLAAFAGGEPRRNYQTAVRKGTIVDRGRDHQSACPLSDKLMSFIFLEQDDLNEQQPDSSYHL